MISYSRIQTIRISNRLSHLAIVLSTLIFYGITWESDPYRTMSTTQIIFLFSLTNIIFLGGKKFLSDRNLPILASFAKNLSTTTYTKTKERGGFGVFYAALASVLIFGITLTTSLISQGRNFSSELKQCTKPTSFRFIEDGLQIARNDKVDIDVRYSWAKGLDTQEIGYWVAGITINSEGVPSSANSYLSTSAKLTKSDIEGKCFDISPTNTNSMNEKLGFTTIKFEES